ncbi:MAG: twin-arginine translocase TatA/TatE family subunit [Rickettsiales bacterium]|jgi:sec-independent protein translocase protein TatA|nr:twin-arginine translocase TatA/TatE family subunit [Rickettsiales bacterium]
MIGWSETLLILLIVLIVFGAGRFPGMMENLAKGLKAFKKTMGEEESKSGRTAKRKPRKK